MQSSIDRGVARVLDMYMEPGYHMTQLDGCDQAGHDLASGIYIARLVTPGFSKSIKMLLLK